MIKRAEKKVKVESQESYKLITQKQTKLELLFLAGGWMDGVIVVWRNCLAQFKNRHTLKRFNK